MKKYKMGFVILHYCAADMTKQCVAAIEKNLTGENYEIVIVDNASYNGTGEELLRYYEADDTVTVLLSEENLGFAKGNNLGFAYAKNELSCDFVCVMNNDVIIGQKDFIQKIYDDYEKSDFAIEGPHITLKNGRENAMYEKIASVEELTKERNGYIRQLRRIHSKCYFFWRRWERFTLWLRIFLGKIHVMEEFQLHENMTEGCDRRQENIVLHGCCIIFSPGYLAVFSDAFDPATFMFREEEILHLRCRQKGLLIVYNPELEVLHLEDVATDFTYQDNREKQIFNLENQIASMRILIEKLQEYKGI